MKIAIVNSVAGLSSKELGDFLRDKPHIVDVYKPMKSGKYSFLEYDVVFNYGYSGPLGFTKVINTPQAVMACVHKPTTFKHFINAGVDTVEWCTAQKDIPKKWKWVVVRTAVDGRKAEGLSYAENIPGKIPVGELYSEYFEHKYEYRVVVFMGKVLGVYYKSEDSEGIWHFLVQPKRGFEKMSAQCIVAAKALGIDYVGFDIIAKDKNTFKILEANSAPILTSESMEAIYSHIYC